MPAWAWPAAAAVGSIISGLAGAAGTTQTNKANRRMAREQMEFQERMSNTSAQRSVADYIKAGLNPALAYERGASSPGGASATMGDAIGAGISNARAAREHIQNMQIAKAQSDAQLTKTRTEVGLMMQSGKESIQRESLLREQALEQHRQRNQNIIMQPATLRLANAQAMLQEMMIPGARNTAAFEERLNSLGTGAGSTALRALLETIKTLRR